MQASDLALYFHLRSAVSVALFEAMSSPALTVPALVVTALAVIAAFVLRSRKNQLPLPPGPRGVPIFGNLFQIPKECGWEKYEEWSKELGGSFLRKICCIHLTRICSSGSDIIHLNMAGMSMIVLNSEKAMVDLFEKRSLNYASRYEYCTFSARQVSSFVFSPSSEMLNLCGWGDSLVVAPYGAFDYYFVPLISH